MIGEVSRFLNPDPFVEHVEGATGIAPIKHASVQTTPFAKGYFDSLNILNSRRDIGLARWHRSQVVSSIRSLGGTTPADRPSRSLPGIAPWWTSSGGPTGNSPMPV
jgi:hypothetical protein